MLLSHYLTSTPPSPSPRKANHFFRTAITTTIPVLAMIFLVLRAKLLERKVQSAVGEVMRKLKKKAVSLYTWALVVRQESLDLPVNFVPGR